MDKIIPPDQLNSPSDTRSAATQSPHHAMKALRKVPEVTVYFWIIKLLTTGMGETTSDYLVRKLDPVLAVALGGIGLAVALILQFLVRRYVAGIYWFAIVMVAIFGTMAADVLHVGFGIPYPTGCATRLHS